MSTVDPKDIEHFTALKNTWWNNTGLLSYNPLRIQFIKEGLVNAGIELESSALQLKGIKILDVGCGGGILTEGLAKLGAHVTGIDASAELINVAKDHAKLDSDILEKVNYIYTTVEEFAQEQDTYDAVVASEVLEHVANPDLFLKECAKILKPGKSIFITTINKTMMSWLHAIVLSEYICGSIPRGTHEWNKFISPEEVQRMLKNYGFETRSIRGVHFNPMNKQWSWSSTTSVFYGLHAVKQREISGE